MSIKTYLITAALCGSLAACGDTIGEQALAGGAIVYKTKLQAAVSTSSTEAEFLAAVHAAKVAKYLRYVLTDLGFPPTGPTPLCEDNASTIKLINNRTPTERSRHIDIQLFAIQDWTSPPNPDLQLQHISGPLNAADDLTKPLGWVLHSRHCHRLMGYTKS